MGRDVSSFKRGDVVAGRYRLTGLLGRGGYGSVYSAEHTGTGQAIALKVMSVDASTTEDDVIARFHREARITASLTDVHTVRVFDVGQIKQGPLFMAMEMLRGPNLFVVLRRLEKADRRMTQAETVAIALPILQSLTEAHSVGLVHRDLKPANIIIATMGDNHSVVKVLDFGIAHTTDSELTTEGQALGTPAYMSPEQVRGDTVDGRADLYSLGVILYRCLAGRPPFEAEDSFALAFKHVNEELPPLQPQCQDEVSDEMVHVVLKALQKSPDDRYQSANDMYAALQAVADAAPAIPAIALSEEAEDSSSASPSKTSTASVLGALVSEVISLKKKPQPETLSTPARARGEAQQEQREEQEQEQEQEQDLPTKSDHHETVALAMSAQRVSANRAVRPSKSQDGDANEAPTLTPGAIQTATVEDADHVARDGHAARRNGNDTSEDRTAASKSSFGSFRVVTSVTIAALVAAAGAITILGVNTDEDRPVVPTKAQIGATGSTAIPGATITQKSDDAVRAAGLIAAAMKEDDLAKREELLVAAAVLAPENAAYAGLLQATKALRKTAAQATEAKKAQANAEERAAAAKAVEALKPVIPATEPTVKAAPSKPRPTPRKHKNLRARKPAAKSAPATTPKKQEAVPFMDF